MLVEKNVPLQHCNTFGIATRAETLVRIRSQEDIRQFLNDPLWGRQPVFVLGGGSNVVLTGDVAPVVLKMEIMGMRLLRETDKILPEGSSETVIENLETATTTGTGVAPAPTNGGRYRNRAAPAQPSGGGLAASPNPAAIQNSTTPEIFVQ